MRFSFISRHGNANKNHNEERHACVRRAKLKVSSTESSSDTGKLDHSHADGESIASENGLAATRAIHNMSGNYSARWYPREMKT